MDRFGKDQHKLLIRQMIAVQQTGSLSEYVDRFFELYDQLVAYQSSVDPLYFTMHFIKGLRSDTQAAVLVQRPQDLDIAIVLAQLQDEVASSARLKEAKKLGYSFVPNSATSLPFPLPVPPRSEKLSVPASNSNRAKSPEKKW